MGNSRRAVEEVNSCERVSSSRDDGRHLEPALGISDPPHPERAEEEVEAVHEHIPQSTPLLPLTFVFLLGIASARRAP